MHNETPFIAIIALGFGLSYIFGMIANSLKLSPLLGYLTAGVLLGPNVPFFYDADISLANEISEVGVMLLMFGVGLHFSIKDLQAVKNISVPGASLRIVAMVLITMALGYLFGFTVFQSAIIGLCLSVSSTVVLLRSLEQFHALETPRGKIAIGWLIVEDLITVLILVLLPTIQFMNSDAPFNGVEFTAELVWTAIKLSAFTFTMFYVGKKLIPYTISRSAATGSRELFTLSVLAIAIGIAYMAVSVFDVSFALGAFFAGMILHESELSHRAAEDTLPLRDAFAVLFFVSVGMIFDWHIVFKDIKGLLFVVFLIILVKTLVAFLLIRLMGKTKRMALIISVSLAQIGEFSFILAGLSVNYGYITGEQKDLILAGAIISIILNPILYNLTEKFLATLDRRAQEALKQAELDKIIGPKLSPELEEAMKQEELEKELICGAASSLPLSNEELEQKLEGDSAFANEQLKLATHTIVVGFGRVGKVIVEQFRNNNLPVSVLTDSLDEFYELNAKGIHSTFGDFKDLENFTYANVKYASGIIFTMESPYEIGYTVDKLYEKYPSLFESDNFVVSAMAHYNDEIDFLHNHHVDNVISIRQVTANVLFTSTLPEKEDGSSYVADSYLSYRPRKNSNFILQENLAQVVDDNKVLIAFEKESAKLERELLK